VRVKQSPGLAPAPACGLEVGCNKGRTLVRMEQSGFRPDQEAAYKGTNSGWKKFISGLERVVAGGNSVAIEKET
jgi:hypothetical protein